jgi:hypothetical protein
VKSTGLAVLLGAIALAGCDGPQRAEADTANDETVLDALVEPLVDSIDQAAGVEAMSEQQKRRIDAALGEAEGEEQRPER